MLLASCSDDTVTVADLKYLTVRAHLSIYFDCLTHHWPFNKSKFNLKSDRVNLVAPACPIECLLYLPNVRAIQYKLGPERLTRLGNSKVLRLPVVCLFEFLGLIGWTDRAQNFEAARMSPRRIIGGRSRKYFDRKNVQIYYAWKPQIIENYFTW